MIDICQGIRITAPPARVFDASTGATATSGATSETQPGLDGLVEHGCACDSGSPGPTGALLALWALGWRRRARRPSHAVERTRRG